MEPLTLSNYLGMLQDDPDSEDAFAGVREVLQSGDPELLGDNPVRLLEAARVGHERRGDLRAAALLIEAETQLVEDDPDLEAALWKELGRLRHEELLDDAGAKEAYGKALELRPGDEEVQEATETIEQAAQSWRQIADRFVQEADDASDATLKTSLLTRAASLVWQYKKRGAGKETDKLFKKALSADPGNARTARLYWETLRARERWSDAASVLIDAADHGRNRDEQLNLYVQGARVLARKVGAEDGAAEAYARVLDFAPTNSEALGYLVEYYTKREEWDHLIALYEDALRSRQKLEDEQGILTQLGMVHWRIRQSPEEAEPNFAKLRKIDPAHPGMLQFYREYLADRDPQRLVTILGDAQRVASDESQRLELATELARAAEKSEATLERAIDAWKAVQRLDPSNEEAQQSLKKLYRRTEKWNALVEVLKAEIDALPEDAHEKRVELLRELVPIYRDKLHLDAMVINTYNAIVQHAPDDAEALAELAGAYESMGRWNDLIQVLTRQAEAAEDPQQKVDIYMRVANLWIERFANYNQATKPLEEVIAVDPENRDALARLKEIYTKKRAWKSLYEVLRKEADLASDPTARLQMKIELAQLAGERLHRHGDAIALWREVVEQEPSTPGALDSLEKLAEREKDWPTLAEALERRVEAADDIDDKVRVLQKLGTVYGEHVGDPQKAASAWKRVLELDPKNGRALRTLRESFLQARDWEGLEALYAEANDWEGLVDVLGNAADKTDDPELKKELSFRAAGVYENRIGEPHRAFRNYERVLSVDPQNERAARALVPIYERDEKWARLASMLEVLLANAPDDDVAGKLELLGRLRQLVTSELRDPQRAFEHAAQAYALAPEDDTVVENLEASAEAAGEWRRLASLYRERLASAPEQEQLRLRRRIAAVAGERLGETSEAIEQLEQTLEADPTDEEAVRVLDGLYRSEGRLADLRKLYLHRLEQAEDAATRHTLLAELASLEEHQLEDTESAAQRYRAILEIDPDDRDALGALDRLAVAEERWNELVDVLRRRCDLARDEGEHTEMLIRLGQLYEQQLGNSRNALDAYVKVLESSPTNEQAVEGVERLESADPELAIEAGRVLEQAYEARGSYEKLGQVLQRRLEAIDEEDEKRALQLRLAELAGSELGDVEGAYDAIESAFLGRPDDPDLWDRLGSAAEQANKHEAMARAMATAMDSGKLDDAQVGDLAARVADVYDVVLGRPADAEPFHQRVLKRDPLDDKAFEALKELYTTQERWDDLQTLYRNRIAETVDAESKLELLMQVCFLFEEILDDPEQAIRYYQEVLELEPEHAGSINALERLYRRTERWRDLVALLRLQLEHAEGQERIESAYELGELYETKLEEAQAAVDQYEAVLQDNPTHLRAQEALERLISDPGQRQRIASILEPLYDAQGAWGELARVLEVQLEDVSDPGAQVGLLMRIAELHESKQHDPDRAFGALARAVEADPADARAREELARVATLRGSQRERAAVLERAIEACEQTPYLQSELLLELARLWDEQEQDHEAAERAYARLIRIDGDNPDVALPASRALERIHLEKGDYPALAEDLRRQIRFETDGEVRGRLLVRLAELLEETLGDVDGAIEAHTERLEVDPADVDALRSLERLYEHKEQWQKLIGTLQQREQVVDGEDEQRQICRRIGQIYEEKLEDRDNAIAAYNDVLARFGQDRETLAPLMRLYEAEEKWEDLLELVQMDLEQAEDPHERAELQFRAAELMRTRTGEVERAIESYDEVLALRPDHPGAIGALEKIIADQEGFERISAARVLIPRYEGSQAYAELIRALEVLADSDDPPERLRALQRAAEVAEVGLEDPSRAFDLMGRAIRVGLAEDELPQLLGEHERLAGASNRWRDYVQLLREVAPDILDGELQTETFMKIAGVAYTRLEDRDMARELYAKVLENQPEHAGALDALEELHGDAEDYEKLLEVLERKTEIAEDPDRRIELLLRRGELCEKQLADVPQAIDAYEQVMMESDRVEAYEGLERLYERAERWMDLSSLYERQLDNQVGDPLQARYKLGWINLQYLNDPHRAIDCFREVLEQTRDHEPTVEALEKIMQDEEHRGAAAEILEPVYLARMDWAKVTGALEARLSDEADIEERKTLLRRLGEIHEDYLEDLEGALEVYARLFQEDPRDPDALETLGRLARHLESWERLAEIQGAALEEISIDDEDTARLAFTTAKLHDDRTGDLEKAAQYYGRALRFDPTHREAFDALESVYRRREAWEPLLELYREQVDVAESDADRLELLHRAAQVRQEQVGDPDAAIETYQEALQVDPTDAVALDALDRLFTARKRWPELADHLRERIDSVVGTDEELELKHRLAGLLADKLDDKEAAVDLYEEIVEADPTHRATVERLEAMVLDENLKERITGILEPIYRQSDQWKKLVAVLEAQVETATDPIDKVRLLGEIARLHEERGGDSGLAFHAWSRAFVEEPHNEEVRAEIDRLAAHAGAWDQLVSVYEQAISACDDAAVVTELLGALASVHDERRGDPRAAIETYERLLQHEPDDGSPLEALEALHTMVGDWTGMVDVLQRKVERAFDPSERGELLRRAGSVQEELLGDAQGAIESYRRAAEEDDRDEIALEALDRLYVQAGRNEDLADILRRRIEIAEEPGDRIEIGLRLGVLCEAQLGRPEEAIDALQRVLDDEPSQPDAVAALGRLYERQGMYPELLDNLRLQAGMAEDDAERLAVQHRIGEVLERQLDDVQEAMLAYQQALEIDQRHEPSIEALLRISKLEDYRVQAAEILEPLLHVQERWDDLAALVESRAEALADPLEKRDELRRLAEIHENGRQDRRGAFEALKLAFAEDPADTQTVDELERLGGILEAWSEVADALAARASAALDPQVGRALYVRLATIAEERLEDPARAIEAYSRAAEQVGDDEELLEALDRLYVQSESWQELADVLERRIAMAADPSQQNELLARLGRLRAEQFDDPRGAFGAYQEVLDRDPSEPTALEAMESLADNEDLALDVVETLDRVYRETNRNDKLADLYDLRINLVETDGERVHLLQEAAQMWEQELGRADKALEKVRKAFELDPRDPQLLDEVERLADASGAWESLRGTIENVSGSEDVDRDLRRDLNLRAAGWYRDRLGDAAAAEARLRAALEADAESVDAHGQLVDLLRVEGREAELVSALRAWAQVELDEHAKTERLREAARLAESALGDTATAGECHAAILESDPSDPESLDELARIRTEQERWDEVVDLLGRRAEVATDPERRNDLRRRMAELYAGPLQNPAKAMEAYEAVLEEDPTDLTAMDALEGLYEQAERWDELRSMLDRRLDMAESDEQRVAARVRLARLMEQAFGKRAEAMEQLREILQLDPQNGEALDELERLLTADEQWQQLVDLLEQRVSNAPDATTQKELLERLAEVYEQRLGDASGAAAVHERILELAPGDRGSLEALARLHEQAGDWPQVANALERMAEVLEGQEAIDVSLRIASLAEDKLEDPERTENALRRAFELDPSVSDTRERLKTHYQKHGEHAKLAMMLDAEAEQAEDTGQKVELFKQIAELHREQLGDPGTAASYLERASELVPDDRGVLLPLCDLYIEAGRQQDAVPVLEKIVESFGNRRSKELAQYHHRLGRALEGMGETDKALQHYDSAFKVDLTNVPILRDLGRLCHSRGDYERAQKTFRALLLQKLDDGAGITKADVYYYLGDISAKQGDKNKAVSMLQRAVAEQKDHAEATALLAELKG